MSYRTVCADALTSVLDNYSVLLELWHLCYKESKDSEIRARAQGVAVQMRTLEYYYASSLAEMVLRHRENLSKTLQQKNISATAEHTAVRDLMKTLESLQEETYTSSF